MVAYYNEIDPYCAQWLRNLIAADLIAPGDVDTRDIRDVVPGDLNPYSRCHFFAGIGGWSVALRLAGVSDHTGPLWTGSCPCQSFSAAGRGGGFADERHLWPYWHHLIDVCRPDTVLGEQVASPLALAWYDLVHLDLEASGYACAAADLPAACVGAPHIRQRLWFVAKSSQPERNRRGAAMDRPAQLQHITDGSAGFVAQSHGGNAVAEGLQRGGQQRQQSQDGGAGFVAHAEPQHNGSGNAGSRGRLEPADGSGVGNAGSAGLQERVGNGLLQREAMESPEGQATERGSNPGFWSSLEWLPCSDGKARPTRPGLFPLAHGIQRRTSKLRAIGNAIVPQVAAAFIVAALDLRP